MKLLDRLWGPKASHIAYRPDIDGLRAVAILLVLGFHAFPAWVPGGFVGVDIFFVISGFLISSILLSDLQRGQFSLATFYARRVRRIFPALIVVLAAVLVFGWFFLWPGEYKQVARHAAGGAGFIANFMFARENGYFNGADATKPLLHLWSLGVEEQFYIFWPVMLAAAWRWKHRAGAMIAVVGGASFVVNIWLAGHDALADFYLPFSRFWELLAGGALAWSAQQGKLHLRGGSETVAALGLMLIAGAAFGLNKTMNFPGWFALLPVAGAVMLIAAGEKAFINRRILAHPAFVAVGLISYPLYLWHWPLLSFAQMIGGEAPSRAVRLSMVAAAFALATLTYFLVEKPIRKGDLDKKKIGALVAIMVLLGVAALGIVCAQGAPSRFADFGLVERSLDSDRLIEDWQQNVRVGLCHLQDPAASERVPQCIETTQPLLWLWGDSHAASLYPGLAALQEKTPFGIAQLTQGGCPPLFDLTHLKFRADCNDINRRILAQAAQAQPTVIMLAAAWSHDDYPMENADIIAHLLATVAQIKQAVPQAEIIVMGPLPRWTSPLPAIYRRALTFNRQMPPVWMSRHLDPNSVVLDEAMRDALAQSGVTYLSMRDLLCGAQGCRTVLGKGPDSLTFIDAEHISAQASVYLMQESAPHILGALGLAQP